MNRAPSKNDRWFGNIFLVFLFFQYLLYILDEHQRRCNGQFIKIKGPLNEKKLKNNIRSLPETSTKKVKTLSVGQLTLDKFVVKPTAFVECHFCRENIHRNNLRLHLDIKCPMRVQ